MAVRVCIHHPPGPPAVGRLGRTRRSLQLAGLHETAELPAQPAAWRALLAAGGPVLLVRAGAWLAGAAPFHLPHPSATGRALAAFGALRPAPDGGPAAESAEAPAARAWRDLLHATGGDFDRLPAEAAAPDAPLASPPVVFLDARAVAALRASDADSFAACLNHSARSFRRAHIPALDAYDDAGLRVFQVITALHRGGAERVTLDLLAALPAAGVRTRLATVGRPLRTTFPTPPGTLELAGQAARGPRAVVALLARAAKRFGADLVHGHLVPGDFVRQLAATGLPLVLTVHNTRAGWPAGLAGLTTREVVLLAACACAVEGELRAAAVAPPVRTVWNGIDTAAFQASPARTAAGGRARRDRGWGPNDVVLIAVANPRPQKRLHHLPGILHTLRALLPTDRPARLLLVGEVLPGNPAAAESAARLTAEIARLQLAPHIHFAGSIAPIADLLAAADVFVSPSAHEGLSLAQLEALAAGLPVVATAVGGTPEVAADFPALHLVPPGASDAEFAQTIAAVVQGPRPLPAPGPRAAAWTRPAMAERYQWLYHRARAAAHRSTPGRGLWLITNNFSTGGAQTSARRLLAGLAARAVPVRAAVVEEHPANPTPGRQSLIAQGIPVFAVPWPADAAAPASVRCLDLLAEIDADPPAEVVFWNLRPAFKVLLADALLQVPVFDVSPGEMFFESLERYFTRPPVGLPYRQAADYGARLAGVLVKYAAETEPAARLLGAPVTVVPNGVPLPADPVAVRAEIPDGAVVFGTAARISPRKRLQDLLDAFRLVRAQIPTARLLVAGGVETGSENYAAELRARGADLPVEWLGETTDLAAFHARLDIFVMISEPAGCPNASLEALAAGLPVIATDCGGAAEQVRPDETGLLVPARDTPALADACLRLAGDSALRVRLARAGRAHIREHFTLDRMVDDYQRIFGLAGAGGSTPDRSA